MRIMTPTSLVENAHEGLHHSETPQRKNACSTHRRVVQWPPGCQVHCVSESSETVELFTGRAADFGLHGLSQRVLHGAAVQLPADQQAVHMRLRAVPRCGCGAEAAVPSVRAERRRGSRPGRESRARGQPLGGWPSHHRARCRRGACFRVSPSPRPQLTLHCTHTVAVVDEQHVAGGRPQ